MNLSLRVTRTRTLIAPTTQRMPKRQARYHPHPPPYGPRQLGPPSRASLAARRHYPPSRVEQEERVSLQTQKKGPLTNPVWFYRATLFSAAGKMHGDLSKSVSAETIEYSLFASIKQRSVSFRAPLCLRANPGVFLHHPAIDHLQYYSKS